MSPRKLHGLGAALAALALAALTGCHTDPYCLNCADGSLAAPDGAADGSTQDARDGAATPDAPDAPDAPDVVVDSGPCDAANLQTDPLNCGACGNVCLRPHAIPACMGGQCVIPPGGCDVGFYDLDHNPDNGCEYACTPVPGATNDATCNMRDDDCDGQIDEDVDKCTDVNNCGACGRVCSLAHSTARCTHTGTAACAMDNTSCVVDTCAAGFYDIDHDPTNGCEYACTPSGAEVCDGRDNDCNGQVDEGDPGGGGACGSSTGACRQGTNHCVMGEIVCQGATGPAPETCNGVDDDCNGTVDDGALAADPRIGGVCGSGVGDCRPGANRCVGGAVVCVGATGPAPEVCDGRDNNCNGMIDDAVPAGGACGSSTGACRPGTLRCVGGTMVCQGDVGPTAETCNGLDDDCNGSVDDGALSADPRIGVACGSSTGQCRAGAQRCVGGAPQCVGATGPQTETCNGLDDDCNGVVDNGIPPGGSCGSSVGACRAGTLQCSGGSMRCVGNTGPGLETCNGIDDDCDGVVDNGFNLATDLNNCGSCGHRCTGAVPNAAMGCSAGACVILACAPGFVDDPTVPGPDCSYACTPSGSAEICNGVDDNCNHQIDEGLTAPAGFCRTAGACMGTTPTCGGTRGWVCNYGPNVDVDPSTGQPAASESRCDGIDNNCNGSADESFTNLGTSCTSGGTGACNRAGSYVCASSHLATTCSATMGTASPELCDGVDNDCDGSVDETALAPGSNATYFVADSWVKLSGSGSSSVWIMQYEASRPGASGSTPGAFTSRACSVASVIPWTNLTYGDANAACTAIGARLCTETEWQAACVATMSCSWSYNSACTTYAADTCNGTDHDIDSVTAGVQNGLVPGGALTSCDAPDTNGRVFDLSGNAREFTAARSAGVNPMRGGSYNSPQNGMTCGFSFSVADDNFRFPNTGFRCCYTGATAP